MYACSRTDINDIIRRAHRILVVLNDDHGVADISQPLEGIEQHIVISLVQSDRRLVKNIQHAHQRGPDLGREPDALGFAAREGRRSAG